MDYRFLQFEKGGPILPLTYNDIKDVTYTLPEQERIKYNRRRVIAGTPVQMKDIIIKLANTYKVDEIILATIAEDFDDRLQSYRLLAKQFDLQIEDLSIDNANA
jgi:alkanesulfonate monooxygenase SsuD/methylene tetrahydromethanopterin reductase-like flavin-dependent oxidoreductase (luciferase family)